jgi:DNA-binding NarL/FixJ family response regulator
MRRSLVLIVSDNPAEIRVLREIIRDQSRGDVMVVGAAGRGEEALSRALSLRPHVIVVNLDPAREGDLELVPRLRGLFHGVGIVALTPQDAWGAEEAVRAAGADRAVERTQVSTQLASVILETGRVAQVRQRMADQGSTDHLA